MNVLNKSRETLNKKDLYFMLTDKSIKKMSDLSGKNLDILDWVIYEDVRRDTGEIQKLMSIKSNDGCYATNSITFIEGFESIVACFGTDFKTISIYKNKSNRGREFLQCSYIS